MASNFFNKASLVMVPDAPIDGKLPSVKPEDRSGDFTFSRGSNLAATRVNKDGLIEKGRENLLLQSNQFDTTWGTTNASVTSGQAGYDGSSNAWLLDKIAAGRNVSQNISVSGVQTFSVYAKANTATWIKLQVWDGSSFYTTSFNLLSGAIGFLVNLIDANTEDLGDGWYRCYISLNASNLRVYIYPAEGDNDTSGTSGSIYIQDAQLEYGLVSTEYIETTTATVQKGILENLPRIDYSGGVSCPSLLLEPQRTNTITDSEYFGSWTKLGAQNVVLNEAVSLDGNLNAALLTRTSANGSLEKSAALTIGSANTFSIFAKAESTSLIGIVLTSGIPITNCVFDLSNQTVSVQLGTPDAYGIEDYGNGWYRCYITDVATGTSATCRISSGGYGTGGVYIYGAQMEAGSYPTSYIPTYGSSVTRSTDSCQIASGISDLLPQGTGTMYVEATIDDAVDTEGYLMRIEQASFANTIFIAKSTAGNLFVSYRNNNSTIFSLQKNNLADTFKAAFAFESGNSVLYVNGEKIGTSSVTYTPAVTYDDLRIGGYSANAANMSGVISQAMVFKTRLTDDECIALTTI